MHSNNRNAEFEAILAHSKLLLDPVAYRAAVAEEKAARVVHRDDGFSCDWAATMPKKAEPVAQPSRTMTDTMIARTINDAVAALPRAPTFAEIEDALGQVVSHLRKHFGAENDKLRAEMQEQLAELRVDVEIARAHAGDGAKVIDMPNPLRARHG